MKNLSEFKPGMHVRSRLSGQVYIVTANLGNRATAVRTQDICNPQEWEKVTEEPEPVCIKVRELHPK